MNVMVLLPRACGMGRRQEMCGDRTRWANFAIRLLSTREGYR